VTGLPDDTVFWDEVEEDTTVLEMMEDQNNGLEGLSRIQNMVVEVF
jgi:hypothetical protein